MARCPLCDGEISEGAVFCNHCGTRLLGVSDIELGTKPCPWCNREIEVNSTRCPYCGNNLSPPASGPPGATTPTVGSPAATQPASTPSASPYTEGPPAFGPPPAPYPSQYTDSPKKKVFVPGYIIARGVIELVFGILGLLATGYLALAIFILASVGAAISVRESLILTIALGIILFALALVFALFIYCGACSFTRPREYINLNIAVGAGCIVLSLALLVMDIIEGGMGDFPWASFVIYTLLGAVIIGLTVPLRKEVFSKELGK